MVTLFKVCDEDLQLLDTFALPLPGTLGAELQRLPAEVFYAVMT